jgi:membrane protein implicated in regulation of membrane protease activity
MQAWWDSLSSSEKGLWLIATFSTVLFALQVVSTLFGLGHSDTDVNTDVDMSTHVDAGTDVDTGGDFHDGGHPGHGVDHPDHPLMGYFTVRNFIAFFLGFSWGGLAYRSLGLPPSLSIILGIPVGLFFVFVVMFLMKALSNLKSEGTVFLENAVGSEATVSIFIPGDLKGNGKVSLTVQGRLMEVEAITRGGDLRRSDRVKVVDVSGGQLIVEKV